MQFMCQQMFLQHINTLLENDLTSNRPFVSPFSEPQGCALKKGRFWIKEVAQETQTDGGI